MMLSTQLRKTVLWPILLSPLGVVACGPLPAIPLPDLGGRTVTVVVQASYPPFSQTNAQTGQPEGWDYDVMAELGRRLNFAPQFVIAPREDIIPGVAEGRYDLAGDGITFTQERQTLVDYPAFYVVIAQRLMVRQDEERVTTMLGFKADTALRIGTLDESTNFDAAGAYFGPDRVDGYATIAAATTDLLAGTIDGVLLDDAAYRAQAALYPGQLKRLPGTVRNDVLGFIVTKGSDLAVPITLAFNEMINDGTAAALNVEWGLVPE